MTKFLFTITILAIVISSCDFIYKDNGRFGHSETKEEAFINGSEVYIYLPDKDSFKLIDNSILKIDTAWTEESFSYKNNNRVLDNSWGYHFSIPIKQKEQETFTFTFSLADTNNRVFTNGAGDNLIQLCPLNLYDTMKVVLEQKDPDTLIGWTHSIITDTITFKRISKLK